MVDYRFSSIDVSKDPRIYMYIMRESWKDNILFATRAVTRFAIRPRDSNVLHVGGTRERGWPRSAAARMSVIKMSR